MSATIKDLAALAGVTNQTISNVFNRPELVKDSTRLRIQSLARDMGYRPNAAARSLRTGVRTSVGLMVAGRKPGGVENILLSDTKLLARLAQECETQNLNLVFGLMQQVITPASDWATLPHMIEHAHVGPVICLSDMWDELASMLRNYKIPAIVVNGPACGLPAVQTDEVLSVETLVDHLVSLGHKRIAFINAGCPGASAPGYRQALFPQGYLKALTRHRLRPYPSWDCPVEDFNQAVEELFTLSSPPTALIGYDEGYVLALADALELRGLRVPQDVSLVAAREIGTSQFVTKPITRITRPNEALAHRAVQWISESLAGKASDTGESTVTRLAAELVVGTTCGPPAPGPKRKQVKPSI